MVDRFEPPAAPRDDIVVRAELFGLLFVLLQNLSRRIDDGLAAHGLSSRQWLLLAVLTRGFDQPPTLSEAAAVYGSSRQNVKQLAGQLAQLGYLELIPDATDRRAVRLHLTDAVTVFDTAAVRAQQSALLTEVFAGLAEDDVRTMRNLVVRCLDHLVPASRALSSPSPSTTPLEPTAPGRRPVEGHRTHAGKERS